MVDLGIKNTLGLSTTSKWTKNIEADARAVKDSHINEAGSDKGLMPAIRDNEERFEERAEEITEPTRLESWFNRLEFYDVETDMSESGHDISVDDLRVGIPGIETPELQSTNLSEYIDEVESKLGAVREGLSTARQRRSQLQEGEDVSETQVLQSLLGESTGDYSDNPEELTESGVATESSELDDIRGIKDNGIPLLDQRIDSLSGFESAYVEHARERADQYHADAKRNIKDIAEGAEEALETFAETVNAAGIVAGYAEDTVNDDNYESELANEDAAHQRPVMEAAQDAVEEAGQAVAAYMTELQDGVDDLEEAADRFGEFLETEEVENMSETVQEYRQGMVDLTENIFAEHADLEDVEADSVDDYVMALMNQSGLTDQVDLPEEQNLSLQPYGREA